MAYLKTQQKRSMKNILRVILAVTASEVVLANAYSPVNSNQQYSPKPLGDVPKRYREGYVPKHVKGIFGHAGSKLNSLKRSIVGGEKWVKDPNHPSNRPNNNGYNNGYNNQYNPNNPNNMNRSNGYNQSRPSSSNGYNQSRLSSMPRPSSSMYSPNGMNRGMNNQPNRGMNNGMNNSMPSGISNGMNNQMNRQMNNGMGSNSMAGSMASSMGSNGMGGTSGSMSSGMASSMGSNSMPRDSAPGSISSGSGGSMSGGMGSAGMSSSMASASASAGPGGASASASAGSISTGDIKDGIAAANVIGMYYDSLVQSKGSLSGIQPISGILAYPVSNGLYTDYWGKIQFKMGENGELVDQTGLFVGEPVGSREDILKNGSLTDIGFYQKKGISRDAMDQNYVSTKMLIEEISNVTKKDVQALHNEKIDISYVDGIFNYYNSQKKKKKDSCLTICVCSNKTCSGPCKSIKCVEPMYLL